MGWLFDHSPVTYASWLNLLSHPAMLIASIIFYAALFIHAWVGVRDILVDYVNPSGLRFILLASLAFFLIVMTLWLLIIVIGLVKL
jgi:succinate dehydrogenase / fumarate reductase membrane anchor subunit